MRPAASAAFEGLQLRAIDPILLQDVRKKDGFVSIYDLLRLVTGQAANACRVVYQRLLETHPELATYCCHKEFSHTGRGRYRATPATDARGVVHILMVLPGQAASLFRMQAADVLVRYLGGDPELVTQIWTNRRAQEELAATCPEHPARLFGEAVEANMDANSDASTEELEDQLTRARIAKEGAETAALQARAKLDRIRAVAEALQVCEGAGFSCNPRYQELIRAAVDDALLPPGRRADEKLDAAAYLHLQGHTDDEVRRLAPGFGKLLKEARLRLQGSLAETSARDFGMEEREIFQYAKREDREFLAACYNEFREHHVTYRNVMNPDSSMRGRVAASLEGTRGMKRRYGQS
jgi:hypothetical protein